MPTYKLQFDNGAKFQTTSKNLTEAHTKIVRYVNNNNLHTCTITCPNGVVRRVCKTGKWHPIHNGFIFD